MKIMKISTSIDYGESINIFIETDQHKGATGFRARVNGLENVTRSLTKEITVLVNGKKVENTKIINNELVFYENNKLDLNKVENIDVVLGEIHLVRAEKDNHVWKLSAVNKLDTYAIKEAHLGKPFDSEHFVEADYKPKTDVHTHLMGSPRASQLIEIGMKHKIFYPNYLLNLAGLTVGSEEQGGRYFSDFSNEECEVLKKQLEISPGEQVRFSYDEKNLERIYTLRKPFLNADTTADFLMNIAKEYQKSGTTYVELSGSQVFDLGPDCFLEKAGDILPQIEKETGVKIKFLAAMTRFDDVEWSLDQLEKLKLIANNPYIAGIDVVGHETNSTLDFTANIKPYMAYAQENDIPWVFRFHAGENPSHPENVREALKIAKEYGVRVRIGHGLYGMDEETLKLAKETNAIFEINATSNLSLNNVCNINGVGIVELLIKHKIPFVLGTDGVGVYQTDPVQEARILARYLSVITGNKSLEFLRISEELLLADAQERERIMAVRSNTDVPTQEQLNALPKHWSEDVIKRKENERQLVLKQFQKVAEKMGAKIHSTEDLDRLFEGKTPFVVSGSSKSHWEQYTEQEKAIAIQQMKDLVESLDPEKVFFVTGGTDYGVEKALHEALKGKGFDVLGVITEDAKPSEIQSPSVNHYVLIKGNWWAKSSFVLDNVVNPHNGKILFYGGGAIVSDEILSSVTYHNLPESQIFLSIAAPGAGRDKGMQNRSYAIKCVYDVVTKCPELVRATDSEHVHLSVAKIGLKKKDKECPTNEKNTVMTTVK